MEKINLNITDIMKHLPHRYPFLLIDKVIDIDPEKSGIGMKCVTANEGFFQGHFPGNPVMPGVLMLEAMAQTCIMVHKPFIKDKNVLFVFSGLDNVKFRRQVIPGDVLKIDIKTVAQKGPLTKCHSIITVDGEIAVEADLSSFTIKQ